MSFMFGLTIALILAGLAYYGFSLNKKAAQLSATELAQMEYQLKLDRFAKELEHQYRTRKVEVTTEPVVLPPIKKPRRDDQLKKTRVSNTSQISKNIPPATKANTSVTSKLNSNKNDQRQDNVDTSVPFFPSVAFFPPVDDYEHKKVESYCPPIYESRNDSQSCSSPVESYSDTSSSWSD